MDEQRRWILSAAAAAATGVAIRPDNASAAAPVTDPFPPMPLERTPGKPGDFDFLTGEWRIHNWRLRDAGWEEFEGEASVHRLLEGRCSVEELRIPARDFSGIGLRLLDERQRLWHDCWVNARSGVLEGPGQPGSFEGGAGIFVSGETENGAAVLYAGIWDRISARSCRWRQGSSRDGGRTWSQNWVMHWMRRA